MSKIGQDIAAVYAEMLDPQNQEYFGDARLGRFNATLRTAGVDLSLQSAGVETSKTMLSEGYDFVDSVLSESRRGRVMNVCVRGAKEIYCSRGSSTEWACMEQVVRYVFNRAYDESFREVWDQGLFKPDWESLVLSALRFVGTSFPDDRNTLNDSDETPRTLFANESNEITFSTDVDGVILRNVIDAVRGIGRNDVSVRLLLRGMKLVASLGVAYGLLGALRSRERYGDVESGLPVLADREETFTEVLTNFLSPVVMKEQIIRGLKVSKSDIRVGNEMVEINEFSPEVLSELSRIEQQQKSVVVTRDGKKITQWSVSVDRYFAAVSEGEVNAELEKLGEVVDPANARKTRNRMRATIAERTLRAELARDVIRTSIMGKKDVVVETYVNDAVQLMGGYSDELDVTAVGDVVDILLQFRNEWLEILARRRVSSANILSIEKKLDRDILEIFLPIAADVVAMRRDINQGVFEFKDITESEVSTGTKVAQILSRMEDPSCTPFDVVNVSRIANEEMYDTGRLTFVLIGCPYLQPPRLLDLDPKKRANYVVLDPFRTDTITLSGKLARLALYIRQCKVCVNFEVIVGNTDTEDVFPEIEPLMQQTPIGSINQRFQDFGIGVRSLLQLLIPEADIRVRMMSDLPNRPSAKDVQETAERIANLVSKKSLMARYDRFDAGFPEVYRGFPEAVGLSYDVAKRRGRARAVAAYALQGKFIADNIGGFFLNLAPPYWAGEEVYRSRSSKVNIFSVINYETPRS